MKELKKKILLTSILGTLIVALGTFYLLEPTIGLQETNARYSFTTQASTGFNSKPLRFTAEGEAITYYNTNHTGKTYPLSAATTSIDVKNFIDSNYTAQDITYTISISDGSHSYHANYNFSINGTAVGDGDVSAVRTLTGGTTSTDALTLAFTRTNNNSGGNVIRIDIKSLTPYEKTISFTINIEVPYIITFDPNGGTVSTTTTQIQPHATYDSGTGLNGSLPTPTRDGYTFIGWYIEGTSFDWEKYANGDNYADLAKAFASEYTEDRLLKHWMNYGINESWRVFSGGIVRNGSSYTLDKYSKNEDHTLHAEWAQSLTVNTSPEADSITARKINSSHNVDLTYSGTNSVTFWVLSGESVTYEAKKAGYTTKTGTFMTLSSSNPVTVTLSPADITVNFNYNGATSGTGITSMKVKYNSLYGTGTGLTNGALPTPTKTHYKFAGWYQSSGEFDATQYGQRYSDIYNAFSGDTAKMTNHWLTHGAFEGRDGRLNRVWGDTKNTTTSTHTLYAMWVPLSRTLNVVMNAVQHNTGDKEKLTCTTTAGAELNRIYDSTITMTSSAQTMTITYYLDEGNSDYTGGLKCTLGADGYSDVSGTFTYVRTSMTAQTLTLTPTEQSMIAVAGDSNTNVTPAKTASYTNYTEGYYLVEMWGAAGGAGYNYSGGKGGKRGDPGYVYGAVYLNRNESIFYTLGGKGQKGNDSSSGLTTNSANGGAHGTNIKNGIYGYFGPGSSGGYSALYKGTSASGSLLMLAGGGGAGAGPGGTAGGQKAGDGGFGGSVLGTILSTNSTIEVLNTSHVVPISGGTVFTGTAGGKVDQGSGGLGGGQVCTSADKSWCTNFAEMTLAATSVVRNMVTVYDGSGSEANGTSLQGGVGIYRGGSGGGGYFGGSGGHQTENRDLSDTSKNKDYPGGGGGGSSYIADGIVFSTYSGGSYQGLSNVISSKLTAVQSGSAGGFTYYYVANPNESSAADGDGYGGYIKITYIGKEL